MVEEKKGLEMKQKKRMLLLIGILVVLCAFYGGLHAWNQHKKTAESAKKKAQSVQILDSGDLTRVSYTKGKKNMTFVKKNNSWVYEKDEKIPLTQSAVEQITGTLESLTAEQKLSSPDALADYGLENPVYKVSYETADGEKGTLDIGNASGENYYAKTESGDTVYTIGSTLVENLQFQLSAFVSLDTVPSISSGNLKKVAVTKDNKTTTYDSEDDLAQLAGGFGTITLTECADYHVTDKSMKKYGLSVADRITATATYKDSSSGKKKSYSVYIGKIAKDGENRYVMPEDSNIVYKVSKDVVKNMITVSDTDSDTEE